MCTKQASVLVDICTYALSIRNFGLDMPFVPCVFATLMLYNACVAPLMMQIIAASLAVPVLLLCNSVGNGFWISR